jgi:hypothetical protein
LVKTTTSASGLPESHEASIPGFSVSLTEYIEWVTSATGLSLFTRTTTGSLRTCFVSASISEGIVAEKSIV